MVIKLIAEIYMYKFLCVTVFEFGFVGVLNNIVIVVNNSDIQESSNVVLVDVNDGFVGSMVGSNVGGIVGCIVQS